MHVEWTLRIYLIENVTSDTSDLLHKAELRTAATERGNDQAKLSDQAELNMATKI